MQTSLGYRPCLKQGRGTEEKTSLPRFGIGHRQGVRYRWRHPCRQAAHQHVLTSMCLCAAILQLHHECAWGVHTPPRIPPTPAGEQEQLGGFKAAAATAAAAAAAARPRGPHQTPAAPAAAAHRRAEGGAAARGGGGSARAGGRARSHSGLAELFSGFGERLRCYWRLRLQVPVPLPSLCGWSEQSHL